MAEFTETAMKRPQESSIYWTRNGEEAEAEVEADGDGFNPILKRPCRRRDDDSFEEFLAVLKRIKAMHRYGVRTSNDLKWEEPALKCVKTVSSNVSWRPSFEWEDFSNAGKTGDVEPGLSAMKAGDGLVEEKEVARHASNNLKPEGSTNSELEGLDLNSLPAEFPLFQ